MIKQFSYEHRTEAAEFLNENGIPTYLTDDGMYLIENRYTIVFDKDKFVFGDKGAKTYVVIGDEIGIYTNLQKFSIFNKGELVGIVKV